MALGLYDPENLKISGQIFGNAFNYDAKANVKENFIYTCNFVDPYSKIHVVENSC